ncbi:gastrokine-1 [Anas platyrhynchos]|uniref:BRICHOS domain-containing protein n=2 Tax=Anas TaxID=8835 RepID=A0A8B9ZG82_ANAPL|nr:gastrokine-1-like [Anas platyrhynchos]
MKFTIVIAFLGVLLAPVPADKNSEENIKRYHGGYSHSPLDDTVVDTGSHKRSEIWKTVWDTKTGYIATKVLSKQTCIISKANTGVLPVNRRFSASPHRDEESRPQHLPPRENRYIISKNRLHNLRPYGERIQNLCQGTPTYFAYPTPGSNFLRQDVPCLKTHMKRMTFIYCGL